MWTTKALKALLRLGFFVGLSAGVFAALPASDAFTGESVPLSASWATPTVGGWLITSNRAGGTNGGGFNLVAWAADTLSANQYAQAVSTVTGGDASGPVVRIQSGSVGGYVLDWYAPDSSITLQRIDSSGPTTATLASCGTAATAPTLKISISGTSLTGYVNGVSACTATDTTYASGQPGIFAYQGGSVDDFVADNVGGGGGGGSTSPGLLLGVGQ